MKRLKPHHHIPVLRRLYLQRDQARLERNRAIAERDKARLDGDRAIAERDQARLERDRAIAIQAISPQRKEQLRQIDGPFAPEYQSEIYKSRNPDLHFLNEQQIFEHAITYGWSEGRIMSLPSMRENFIELLQYQKTILEIGPFCNPITSGSNSVYFDVLDSVGLKRRAEAIGYPIVRVPAIDYVSPVGDLSIIDRVFSAVTSSHCIEHQPDLVKHLRQVGDILEAGGFYFLVIPDKRYCFDHFISASTIAGVVDAHIEQRRVHRPASVIEHRALTTHNDGERHWLGDHSDPGHRESVAGRTIAAIREFEQAHGSYIDVHAWQFTPDSFRDLIENLHALELSPLKPLRVYNTPKGRFEFCAILQKVV
jgi:SAM-dependent methyltransferase